MFVSASQSQPEVSGLGAAGCLERARATDVAARAAERDKLRLALRWCHLPGR